MPSRFVSLAILVYWSIAAFCLLTWDIIPELSLGYAPDMRSISLAGDGSRPVRWDIQVLDNPPLPDVPRLVGGAVTASSHRPDGWFELTSQVTVDAGGLLRGTAFVGQSRMRLAIASRYLVDPSGNLHSFTLDVKTDGSPEALIEIRGQHKGRKMEIVSHGPVEMLNKTLEINYPSRSVVNDVLGPLDRLPGLQVGRRWDTQMINPFTGQIGPVRVKVARVAEIRWNGTDVNAFEVVQDMKPLPIRTWVRLDGVILRQEVPSPFFKLILERRAEADGAPSVPQSGVPD